MKYILLFISFFFLSLLNIKSLDVFSHSIDGKMGICAQNEWNDSFCSSDNTVGYILTASSELPCKDMHITDAQSLARQLRVCGRTNRTVNFCSLLLSKTASWRTAWSRIEALSLSFSHLYSTMPYPYWNLSSDYYVYGIRRILI